MVSSVRWGLPGRVITLWEYQERWGDKTRDLGKKMHSEEGRCRGLNGRPWESEVLILFPEPVDTTFYSKRVNIMWQKMELRILRGGALVGLKSNDSGPYNVETEGVLTNRRGGSCSAWPWAETGEMWPQDMECCSHQLEEAGHGFSPKRLGMGFPLTG